MKILSWNVNGYRAAWKKGFADKLRELKPDIMCIQETKAWEEQLTEEQCSPFEYKSVFSQPERKGYSGVATFSLTEPEKVIQGFAEEEFDREGRVIITDHTEFLLANIYFPNGRMNKERLEFKMAFYEKTLNIFSKYLSDGHKIIVTGDYNTAHKPIDLARPKENAKISGFLPVEREWIDRWIDSGFIDIFRKFNEEPHQYSWWDMRTRARDRNIGWRLDYFFVSENLLDNVKDAWIEAEIYGSDHCPVGLELDF